MSLENNRITPEQAKIPESLTPQNKKETSVHYMDVGQYSLINAAALWYDEEGYCWIDTDCPTNVEVSHDYPSDYRIGVLRLFEGFVVDVVTPSSSPARLDKWTTEQLEDKFGEVNKEPVIAIITNNDELEAVKQIYEEQFKHPFVLSGNDTYFNQNDISKRRNKNSPKRKHR